MSTGGSLENQIQDLLMEPPSESERIPWPTISRVPTSMRPDSKSYEPELVSIGPLHYHDEALVPMLKHKLRFFVRLSERLYGSPDTHNDLKKAADKLVDRVRQCYSESFEMITDSDFSWMIVLDGCFILELFRHGHLSTNGNTTTSTTTTKGRVADDDDPIYRTRWILPRLRMDLIKMENQLPYFVLQELYDLTTRSGDREPSLTEYAANFFYPLVSSLNEMPAADQLGSSHPHLLALFHSTICPESLNNNAASTSISMGERGHLLVDMSYVGSASDLWYYGIKLTQVEGGLLDIGFTRTDDGPKLEIPNLVINQNTISLFRNLLAYELCDRRVPSYVTSYIMFFHQLVSSAKDVRLLLNQGIMNHTLVSDEEMATQIGCLYEEVAFAYDSLNCYLHTPIRNIILFKINSNWWLKVLRKEYFNTPGKLMSFCFAFIGVYLSIMQTVFTVYPYGNRKN